MNLKNSALGYSLIGIALFGIATAVRADQAILLYGGNGYGNQRIFHPTLAFFSNANIYDSVDVGTLETKVSAYSDSVTNSINHFNQGTLQYQDLTYVQPSGLASLELVLTGAISRSTPTTIGSFLNNSQFAFSAAFVGANYTDKAELL